MFALIGQRGTGKTQLAVDLIKERIDLEVFKHENGPNPLSVMSLPTRYYEALDFFTEIKSTYRKDAPRTQQDIIEAFATIPLIVFDEIGVRGETKWEDDLFFSMMNKRYASRRDTLLIGNVKAPELAATVGPSIASRMQETGGIIECSWSSFRSKN